MKGGDILANIVSYEYPTSKFFKDLSGMTFGRLHVDSYYGKDKNYGIYYNCTCSCPNKTKLVVPATSLKCGDAVSCGCYHREELSRRATKHGLTDHPLYWVLRSMKNRCYKPSNPEYINYGDRGITICDEWLDKENGFINFYNWAINNGYEKGLTIDRIDVNGNYCPENCRWTNTRIQSNNKRNNRFISLVADFTDIGKEKIIYTFTVSQWSEITKIPTRSILRRILKYGWSVERTLTSITDSYGRILSYVPIIIPEDMMQYNQPEKFSQSIHD